LLFFRIFLLSAKDADFLPFLAGNKEIALIIPYLFLNFNCKMQFSDIFLKMYVLK